MKSKIKLLTALFTVLLMYTFAGAQDNNPSKRYTPQEIEALTQIGAGAGTSGVNGIQTRILKGDPNQPGLYTIQLTVPANTKIEAHDHPDDRIATVISGTWHIGYGSAFDEKKLKALKPGSFYTEPPNVPHYARTGNKPVTIQISGYGPTGTEYVKKENK